MPAVQRLSLEAFTAILAANGHTPDEDKVSALYAALHTVEALQRRVRSGTADIAVEPSHIFVESATSARSATKR